MNVRQQTKVLHKLQEYCQTDKIEWLYGKENQKSIKTIGMVCKTVIGNNKKRRPACPNSKNRLTTL